MYTGYLKGFAKKLSFDEECDRIGSSRFDDDNENATNQ